MLIVTPHGLKLRLSNGLVLDVEGMAIDGKTAGKNDVYLCNRVIKPCQFKRHSILKLTTK